MNISEYIANPCGASSLPYWKAKITSIPEGMLVLHDLDFDAKLLENYTDEPYFRLYHSLDVPPTYTLPDGFAECEISPGQYAAHINGCYPGAAMSEDEMASYLRHEVYDRRLWIAAMAQDTGQVAATGIGELDRTIGEGVIEWAQVSPEFRGRGLGAWVVSELLRRMAEDARFATVSGQRNNPSDPEGLYRRCGFVGSDVWHVLRLTHAAPQSARPCR